MRMFWAFGTLCMKDDKLWKAMKKKTRKQSALASFVWSVWEIPFSGLAGKPPFPPSIPPRERLLLLFFSFLPLVYHGMTPSSDVWPCATTVGKVWLQDSQRRITCAPVVAKSTYEGAPLIRPWLMTHFLGSKVTVVFISHNMSTTINVPLLRMIWSLCLVNPARHVYILPSIVGTL